jgi:hypothetical protein
MANTFAIVDSEYERHVIQKEIRDRTKECHVPRCWSLKDESDKGEIYLDRTMHADESENPRGRHVQMRRYLFYVAYGFVPVRRKMTMRCGNTRCINPSHVKVRAWEPSARQIAKLLKLGWLSAKDAHDWYYAEEPI